MAILCNILSTKTEILLNYDFETLKDMIQKENPKILLLASPNNPTGNGLTPKELDELLAEVPSQTVY